MIEILSFLTPATSKEIWNIYWVSLRGLHLKSTSTPQELSQFHNNFCYRFIFASLGSLAFRTASFSYVSYVSFMLTSEPEVHLEYHETIFCSDFLLLCAIAKIEKYNVLIFSLWWWNMASQQQIQQKMKKKYLSRNIYPICISESSLAHLYPGSWKNCQLTWLQFRYFIHCSLLNSKRSAFSQFPW